MIRMIAITISNSMREKPRRFLECDIAILIVYDAGGGRSVQMGVYGMPAQNSYSMPSRSILFVTVAISLSSRAFAQQQLVQSYPLNVYSPYLDGQWEGIRYASDGNIYFASSSQSAHHGAAFFK